MDKVNHVDRLQVEPNIRPQKRRLEENESEEEETVNIKGRFSKKEKRILFNLIRADGELLSSFLHQLKRRNWNGKSWMYEIGNRFNEVAVRKRSHDAIRHHLKLRRSVDKISINQETLDMITLLKHTMICSKPDACTRCLQLDRLRVKKGLACCGAEDCKECNKESPHVLQPFDVQTLLLSIESSPEAESAKQDLVIEPQEPLMDQDMLQFHLYLQQRQSQLVRLLEEQEKCLFGAYMIQPGMLPGLAPSHSLNIRSMMLRKYL